MPWDRSRNEEEKGQRTLEGVVEFGLPGLSEIYEKGEETMVPVIHMISTWKLSLDLTFKVMFMFIF